MMLAGLNMAPQCEQRNQHGDQQGDISAAHKVQELVCNAPRRGQ
jgi:hypothetical protein